MSELGPLTSKEKGSASHTAPRAGAVADAVPLTPGDTGGTGQMSLMGQITEISSAKPSKMPGEELDAWELGKSPLSRVLPP